MKRFLVSLSVLLTVACATPETPAQAVYLAQSNYAAALKVEVAYSKLPRCGMSDSPMLCSDPAIVKKVKTASDIAWTSIKEAQVAVRTPGFAESKVTTVVASATALTNAFVEITNTLGVK